MISAGGAGFPAKSNRNTILVVDDEPFVLATLTKVLNSAGYVAFTCELWGKVGGMLRRVNPDLVLLDYNMPSLKGDDLCSIIKHNSSNSNIKVVMFSGEDPETLAAVTKKCGADGYIKKGQSPDRLIRELERYLPRPTVSMSAARRRLGRVLAVDDSPVFLSMYKKVLPARFDCRVDEAKNGADAMAALERDKYDLILLDVNMPVMNGLAFLEQAALSPVKLPPVIMASTEGKDGDVLRAMKLGAASYLVKPFTPDGLFTVVDGVMDRR